MICCSERNRRRDIDELAVISSKLVRICCPICRHVVRRGWSGFAIPTSIITKHFRRYGFLIHSRPGIKSAFGNWKPFIQYNKSKLVRICYLSNLQACHAERLVGICNCYTTRPTETRTSLVSQLPERCRVPHASERSYSGIHQGQHLNQVGIQGKKKPFLPIAETVLTLNAVCRKESTRTQVYLQRPARSEQGSMLSYSYPARTDRRGYFR